MFNRKYWKMMKRVLGILTLVFAAVFDVAAKDPSFKDESLNYVISYKWGLIHKDAGTATLTLKNNGDVFSLKLTGKSKPWADNFYQVRDTLTGTIRKAGFKPLSYTKIAHEDGKYSRDDLVYSYHGNVVEGNAHRVKVNKKGERSESSKSFSAEGKVFDMLSVFYFLRTIDYSLLSQGEEITTTMFSGSKMEALTIRCVGTEDVKLRDKTKMEAFHIKFRFTTEGKKKSSDDIDTWISTDPSHIPLMIVGSLPVGQIRCVYLPNS